MSVEPNTIITPSDYSKGTESTTSVPCGICRRQFSRYTCPKCNLLYCSLQCFRSPNHADCSEAFYKTEVENDIHSAPSKTAEERQKMMELLKRFEEDSLDDENSLFEDEEDDLASQFDSIDLDAASYDEMWSALTPEQRDKFLKALNDPSSELAQQLLASEELEKQIEEPWWERSANTPVANGRRYGTRPQMMHVPEAALKASQGLPSSGPSLLYNIFATLIAYAYVTRYLSTSPLSTLSSGDPEHQEARRLFTTLVPFLTDKRSKTVLPSLSAIITDLWSRFEPGTMTPSFFALLMRDAEKLTRPSSIVSLSPDSVSTDPLNEHTSANTLLALSDISALYKTQSASGTNAVAAKIAFYAAKIIATPTHVLTTLTSEATARAALVEREERLNETSVGASKDEGTHNGKVKIEELT